MSAECPMCSLTFSVSNIERHASKCGLSTEVVSPKPASLKGFVSEAGKLGKSPLVARQESTKSSASRLFFGLAKRKPEDESQVEEKKIKMSDGSSVNGKKHISRDTIHVASNKAVSSVPLAEVMRPRDLESYCGQEASIGPGTQLRALIESEHIPSLILWGPPGCGKTSLANVIANRVKDRAKFVKMSACTCGVNDVRDVVKQAKNDLALLKRRTILFLDEVHRFNKAQQDAFLPHIESGVITFIGATTENPSFSLNAALLSRCRVVVLDKLSPESVEAILRRALADRGITVTSDDGLSGEGLHISLIALSYLANIVDGDARSALNTLQILLDAGSKPSQATINLEDVKEAALRSHVLYDRSGDQHYFMASALQKSIRGSDDNAALYWLARMLKGGEDPAFIARRLVRCASEDVGLADPTALPLAVAAFQGSQLIGKPECDVLLAQATVHLARAKKSHEVYKALLAANQIIDQGSLPPVPLHLRNATSQLTRQQGWSKGYSSDLEKVHLVSYMPEGMENTNFFRSSN